MCISQRYWPIALETPPQILEIARGIHGQRAVERYHLSGIWCMHLYQYTGELLIDGISFPIRPGYMSVTPPDARLEFHYQGRSEHLYVHFSLPHPSGQPSLIPAMQDVQGDIAELRASFEQALIAWTTRPTRTKVRIWDLLWQLVERHPAAQSQTPPPHPAVEKVRALIDLRLSEPLRVATLAHEVGLSQNHLTRLFRQAYDCTVTGYIQHRRLQRARYLLTYSTQSVKSIAAEVGMSDLQMFNRMIQRRLGVAPRQFRHIQQQQAQSLDDHTTIDD